jgi:hypothetical protein
MMLYGHLVIVQPPVPVFKSLRRFKRHRKKKNLQPRVRKFSHYIEIVRDDEILQDRIHKIFYVNERTAESLRRALIPETPRGRNL